MNINEALYDPDRVRDEICRLLDDGVTEDEAFQRVAEEVTAATEGEAKRGVVHGEVVELKL